MSEGEKHLSIKRHIAQTLASHSDVTDLQQEHHLGPIQADMTFSLRGTPSAIEIQQSNVSWRNIVERTRAYHQLGISVLWILASDSPLLKGVDAAVPTWQRSLHALYFGVVYYWLRDQLVQPLRLERCVNPRRQYYDFQVGRWHSPLYEHLRMPWSLEPVHITDLHSVRRSAARYNGYELPEAFLLNLPYEVLQKAREESKQYLDYTRNHSISWLR